MYTQVKRLTLMYEYASIFVLKLVFFSSQKFKLTENFEVDRRNRNCDFFKYSPAETSTINTPNSQICINIPREDSVISLLNSYLDSNFEVIRKLINPDMEMVMIYS